MWCDVVVMRTGVLFLLPNWFASVVLYWKMTNPAEEIGLRLELTLRLEHLPARDTGKKVRTCAVLKAPAAADPHEA